MLWQVFLEIQSATLFQAPLRHAESFLRLHHRPTSFLAHTFFLFFFCGCLSLFCVATKKRGVFSSCFCSLYKKHCTSIYTASGEGFCTASEYGREGQRGKWAHANIEQT